MSPIENQDATCLSRPLFIGAFRSAESLITDSNRSLIVEAPFCYYDNRIEPGLFASQAI